MACQSTINGTTINHKNHPIGEACTNLVDDITRGYRKKNFCQKPLRLGPYLYSNVMSRLIETFVNGVVSHFLVGKNGLQEKRCQGVIELHSCY